MTHSSIRTVGYLDVFLYRKIRLRFIYIDYHFTSFLNLVFKNFNTTYKILNNLILCISNFLYHICCYCRLWNRDVRDYLAHSNTLIKHAHFNRSIVWYLFFRTLNWSNCCNFKFFYLNKFIRATF